MISHQDYGVYGVGGHVDTIFASIRKGSEVNSVSWEEKNRGYIVCAIKALGEYFDQTGDEYLSDALGLIESMHKVPFYCAAGMASWFNDELGVMGHHPNYLPSDIYSRVCGYKCEVDGGNIKCFESVALALIAFAQAVAEVEERDAKLYEGSRRADSSAR